MLAPPERAAASPALVHAFHLPEQSFCFNHQTDQATLPPVQDWQQLLCRSRFQLSHSRAAHQSLPHRSPHPSSSCHRRRSVPRSPLSLQVHWLRPALQQCLPLQALQQFLCNQGHRPSSLHQQQHQQQPQVSICRRRCSPLPELTCRSSFRQHLVPVHQHACKRRALHNLGSRAGKHSLGSLQRCLRQQHNPAAPPQPCLSCLSSTGVQGHHLHQARRQ